MPDPAAVAVAGLTAGYAGKAVLHDLTFTVEPGELVCAVGPSGSGKTTLLRALTGRSQVYAGTAAVFGEQVRPGRPAHHVGYVPQLTAVQTDFPLRVREAVLLGLTSESARVPWFSRAEGARADALLERLGIAPLARQPISELSGGQQQRVLLARAMVRGSRLVLLDEPTSGVDLQTRHDVLRLLGELNADGMTVLLTTHDINWVAAHLPRVLCLNGGLVADGSPRDVFTTQVIRKTYGAHMRVIHDGDLLLVADDTPMFPERRQR